MQDNLNNYGVNFQYKSIYLLLTNNDFLTSVLDIVDPDYYESEAMGWIVKTILKYYQEYKTLITLDAIKVELIKLSDEVRISEIKSTLRLIVKQSNSTDLAQVKSETFTFFVNQNMKKALLESVDLLKVGKYDDISKLMTNAVKAGYNTDLGLYYNVNIADRYEQDFRLPIPTGWGVLDEILKGGLSFGELGVIMAPPGIGKTWFLCNIGMGALLAGKNVVHISLELSESYVAKRYDALLLRMPTQLVGESLDVLQSKIDNIKGNLKIKWFPTKSIGLIGIEAYVNKLKLLDFKPDLLIIDYADLLKIAGRYKEKYDALLELYEELRGLAGVMELPVWSASQVNRAGSDVDVIEGANVSDSYGKIFTSDVVLSVSRKIQDKGTNTARVHVIKNRFGPDGITFPSKFDTNTPYIELYYNDDSNGIELNKKMVTNDQYDKINLKNKFLAYKDSGRTF